MNSPLRRRHHATHSVLEVTGADINTGHVELQFISRCVDLGIAATEGMQRRLRAQGFYISTAVTCVQREKHQV